MKKFLPIGILAVAIIFILGVFMVVRNRNAAPVNPNEEDETVAELPFENRPYTVLTPKPDGHWLTLDIKNINVPGAVTIDYELIYKTKEGTTQGVPGSIKLNGADINRDLLLGSESSGKFRYDEGVQDGTLTLRFRNDRGKLVGKLATDFHLQSGTTELSSKDGQFKFTVAKAPAKTFFVTMNTFGVPAGVTLPGVVTKGPYIITSSDNTKYSGKFEMGEGQFFIIDGTQVTSISPTEDTSIGTFISI